MEEQKNTEQQNFTTQNPANVPTGTGNASNEGGQKQNPYLVPISIVVAGCLIALAIIIVQSPLSFFKKPGASDNPPPQGQTGTPQEQVEAKDISIDLENWPSMGNPSASVVVVEYADFNCPFCGKLWKEVLPLIKRDYIDTGKARFVYKDFIVVGGDRAAEATHCAGEQNAFWQYHDLLFERQATDKGQWSQSSIHRQYARELDIDANLLVECFESRRYQEKVSASTKEAYSNGGQGTPFTLVNNIPVSGAQPFSAFQQVIEAELAK